MIDSPFGYEPQDNENRCNTVHSPAGGQHALGWRLLADIACLKTRRVCTDADIGANRLWDIHVDGGKSEMDLEMWLLVEYQSSKGMIIKRGTFTDIWSRSGLDGEIGTRDKTSLWRSDCRASGTAFSPDMG
jgi:hypothetical protein